MAELNTIITLRQGTTAEWAVSTVRLREGEMGLEYLADGTVKIKAGILGEDGQGKLWADLPYIGSDVKAANVFQVELAEGDVDDIAAIEAQVAVEGAEKQDGDVAIVKALIANGKYSYTSYVYEVALDVEGNASHGWSAMDGNYSAANVFLKDKIVLAGDYGQDSRKDKITSIGNLRIGDEIAAGTSLQALFMDMLSQRLQPANPTNPAASITLYMDGATKKSAAGAVEVGTTINPSYTASLSAGSYTYGPATGITASSWEISDTDDNKASTASGKFAEITIGDSTNYRITAKANYAAGAIAVDNLGDPSNPTIQIASGSKSANGGYITGYRAWFMYVGESLDAIDSAFIRGTSNMGSTPTTQSGVNIPAGTKRVMIAIPTTSSLKLKQVIDVDGMGLDVFGNFTPTAVDVEGLNGYTAKTYNVWVAENVNGMAATHYNLIVS